MKFFRRFNKQSAHEEMEDCSILDSSLYTSHSTSKSFSPTRSLSTKSSRLSLKRDLSRLQIMIDNAAHSPSSTVGKHVSPSSASSRKAVRIKALADTKENDMSNKSSRNSKKKKKKTSPTPKTPGSILKKNSLSPPTTQRIKSPDRKRVEPDTTNNTKRRAEEQRRNGQGKAATRQSLKDAKRQLTAKKHKESPLVSPPPSSPNNRSLIASDFPLYQDNEDDDEEVYADETDSPIRPSNISNMLYWSSPSTATESSSPSPVRSPPLSTKTIVSSSFPPSQEQMQLVRQQSSFEQPGHIQASQHLQLIEGYRPSLSMEERLNQIANGPTRRLDLGDVANSSAHPNDYKYDNHVSMPHHDTREMVVRPCDESRDSEEYDDYNDWVVEESAALRDQSSFAASTSLLSGNINMSDASLMKDGASVGALRLTKSGLEAHLRHAYQEAAASNAECGGGDNGNAAATGFEEWKQSKERKQFLLTKFCKRHEQLEAEQRAKQAYNERKEEFRKKHRKDMTLAQKLGLSSYTRARQRKRQERAEIMALSIAPLEELSLGEDPSRPTRGSPTRKQQKKQAAVKRLLEKERERQRAAQEERHRGEVEEKMRIERKKSQYLEQQRLLEAEAANDKLTKFQEIVRAGDAPAVEMEKASQQAGNIETSARNVLPDWD